MEQREIFTIGYGGRPTDEFVAMLKHYKIDILVDVRTQPYSKFNPDFTRVVTLEYCCARRLGLRLHGRFARRTS